MNRVAAQAARDKKKVQQSDVERLVSKLAAENRVLRAENAELRQRRTQLESENANLRSRLESSSRTATAASSASEAGSPERAVGVGAGAVVAGAAGAARGVSSACAVSPAVVGLGLQQRVRALLSALAFLALSSLCLCLRSRLCLWPASRTRGQSPLSLRTSSPLSVIAPLQSPSPSLALFAISVRTMQQVEVARTSSELELQCILLALATRLKQQMRCYSHTSLEYLKTQLHPLRWELSPTLTARRMRCH